MRSTWFRQLQKRIALWSVLLCAIPPFARATDAPEIFYYLAVPSCPAKGECVFVACIQLDRLGIPVAEKAGKSGAASFFSIWRSSYWDEKAPGAAVKTAGEWKTLLNAEAERAVARRGSLSQLPDPIRKFFVELEKLRCASLRKQIILQPLFKTEGFVGWEHVTHLDVLATASTISAADRSKALLAGFHDTVETDPAKSLVANLASLGVKPRTARYWPEYNLFVIEADAKFKEIETLFSAMY